MLCFFQLIYKLLLLVVNKTCKLEKLLQYKRLKILFSFNFYERMHPLIVIQPCLGDYGLNKVEPTYNLRMFPEWF